MLTFVPVRFDLYRPLKPHLRWTLQNLISFADRAGRCYPSVRKLAEVTGVSKSTVSRHLAELSRDGRISRHRKPGGSYVYTIDSAFLPAGRGVSHASDSGVPPAPAGVSRQRRPEEETSKKTSDSHDDSKWEPRLRAWRHSGGKFWNAFWGPKPSEPGCFVPAGLLTQAVRHG